MLLRRLRVEGHRVLLFAQMTKMLDILEVLLYATCLLFNVCYATCLYFLCSMHTHFAKSTTNAISVLV
jgi:hypothetical protein